MNELETQTADDMTDEELIEAFRGEDGIEKVNYGTAFAAWTDDAGRRVLKLSTSHKYGRSTARDIGSIIGMTITYNPHGSELYLTSETGGMSEERAEKALSTPGFKFSNARGKTVEIVGEPESSGYEKVNSETDDPVLDNRFESLKNDLVNGDAAPINADDVLGDDDSEEELLTDALEAAADAIESHGFDSTGSMRYNRRRRYDAGFDAAMNVLRGVPVDERPEGIVSEIDERVAAVTKERPSEPVETLRQDSGTYSGEDDENDGDGGASESDDSGGDGSDDSEEAESSDESGPTDDGSDEGEPETEMVETYSGPSVWDAARHVADDARVRVDYRSKNSGNEKSVEGEITTVLSRDAADGWMCRLVFRRDDGHIMACKAGEGLFTSGSHHPYVGSIENLTVRVPRDESDSIPRERDGSMLAAD